MAQDFFPSTVWYHKIISLVYLRFIYLLTWALAWKTRWLAGLEDENMMKDHLHETARCWLVVPTHLKNISQHGNLPQIRVEIKTYLKPPPRSVTYMNCSLLVCVILSMKKIRWHSLKLTYIARGNWRSPKRKGLLLNHHFFWAMWIQRSVSSWLCRSIYHELFCPSILTKRTTRGQNLYHFMIDGMVIKHESKHSNFDDHDT